MVDQDLLNAVASVANRLSERGYDPQVVNRTGILVNQYAEKDSIKHLSYSVCAESFIDFLEENKIISK